MPELITHVAVAHISRRAAEILFQKNFTETEGTIILVGAVLPDVFARVPRFLYNTWEVHWATTALHTPLAVLLECYLMALCFGPCLGPNKHGRFMLLISAGALSHLLLDMGQRALLLDSYFWLFPFSWATFNIPLYWASDTILAVPFLLVSIVFIELWRRRKVARPAF